MKTSTSLAMAHGALLLALALALVLALRPMPHGAAANDPPVTDIQVRLSSHLSSTGSPHFETFIKQTVSGDGGEAPGLDAHARCSQDGVCTVTLRVALPLTDHKEPQHKTSESPFSVPLTKPGSTINNNQDNNKQDESHSRCKNVEKPESLRQEHRNLKDDHEKRTETSGNESPSPAPHGIPIPLQQRPLHQQPPPFQHFQEFAQSQLPKYCPQQCTEYPVQPQQCFRPQHAPRPCFESQRRSRSCCPFQSFHQSPIRREDEPQPENQVKNESQAQTQHTPFSHEESQPQDQCKHALHSTPPQPHFQQHFAVQSRSQTSFQTEKQHSVSQPQSHYQLPLHQPQTDRQNYSQPEIQYRYTEIHEEVELQRNQQQLPELDLQSQFQQLQSDVTPEQTQFGEENRLLITHFNSDRDTSQERLQEYTDEEADFSSNVLSEKQREKNSPLQMESMLEKQPQFWRIQSNGMIKPEQLPHQENEYFPSNEYPEKTLKTQLHLNPTSVQYEQKQQVSQSIPTFSSQDTQFQTQDYSRPQVQQNVAGDKPSFHQEGRSPWAKTNHYTIPRDDEQREWNSRDNNKKETNFRGRPSLTAKL